MITTCIILKNQSTIRKNHDKWNRGRTELDNIDTRWGTIIDAYTYIAHDDVILIPVDICGGGDGPGGVFSVQQTEIIADFTCINGTLYEIQPVQWYTKISTKNDGLLTPESCVWDPGSALVGYAKNKYYDDVPDEGGYNHFELKRYKRAYTLPSVFNAGDYAPPMREAARWIDNDFQDGN